MRHSSIFFFLSIVILLSVLNACNGGDKEPQDEQKKPKSKEEKKLAMGKKVYRMNCVSCHGPRGKQGTSGAYDLSSTKLSGKQITDVVTNGRKAMMPYKKVLDPSEIDAVVAYIQTLQK